VSRASTVRKHARRFGYLLLEWDLEAALDRKKRAKTVVVVPRKHISHHSDLSGRLCPRVNLPYGKSPNLHVSLHAEYTNLNRIFFKQHSDPEEVRQ
jgi:hypothetical protein